MANLHFIRGKVTTNLYNYYEEMTDVWVFGDVEGYRALEESLHEATSTKEILRPSMLGIDLNSMRVCILPAAASPKKQPRLKFVERVVFLVDSPEMELVIYGNSAGYRELADCLQYACTEFVNDPSDHVHLDDYMDRRIVRRSVALNIRGPLESWSRDGLKNYGAFVFQRQATYVPDDIEYLTKKLQPYDDPVAGEIPFVLR